MEEWAAREKEFCENQINLLDMLGSNEPQGLRETLYVLHLSEATYLDSFRDLNKALMDLDAFVKRLSSLLSCTLSTPFLPG